MRVYRVERADGCGPYVVNGEMHTRLFRAVNHFNGERPDPEEDGIGGVTQAHVCGFASIEAYRNWFKWCRKLLRDNGYRLVVYVGIDVKIGRRQVMFRKGPKLGVLPC
jgi:hypothetical protein